MLCFLFYYLLVISRDHLLFQTIFTFLTQFIILNYIIFLWTSDNHSYIKILLSRAFIPSHLKIKHWTKNFLKSFSRFSFERKSATSIPHIDSLAKIIRLFELHLLLKASYVEPQWKLIVITVCIFTLMYVFKIFVHTGTQQYQLFRQFSKKFLFEKSVIHV